MDPISTKRRMLWHGTLIFIFGLLAGAATPAMTNPRMGVAAHLGGVMSGMFLVLVGLIWEEIHLSSALRWAAFWLFLYAGHTGWLAQFLAALFGTNRGTPIAAAGFRGVPWQENLVYYLAVSFSLAILLACVLALWGLSNRGKSATFSA